MKRRWKVPIPTKKMDMELTFMANHIEVNNEIGNVANVTPKMKELFISFWKNHEKQALCGRDSILKSFCPQVTMKFRSQKYT